VDIDTVIVDEAGCVLEMAIPVLLRWRPSNLVLIGDHQQLAPFTSLGDGGQGPSAALLAGGHARWVFVIIVILIIIINIIIIIIMIITTITSLLFPAYRCLKRWGPRSLMERAISAGCPAPMLTVQYRMHPAISRPVSDLFYSGRLATPPGLASERAHPLAGSFKGPRAWVECNGEETLLRSGGYRNDGEVEAVVRLLDRVLRAGGVGASSVFIITFYNGQKRAIEKALEERRGGPPQGVAVLSVDAVQGSEAEVRLLS
jgi:superfamily I DNA and/or RNA helicase